MTYRGIIYFLNDCGLVPSLTRDRKRCFRWGKGKSAARYTGAPFPQRVPPTHPWHTAKVFAVSIPQHITERWQFQRPFYYFCAVDEAAAVKELDAKFRKIILGSKKLAKRTLGVGMSKLATASGTNKVAAGSAPTARVRKASNKYSDAKVLLNGAEYAVRMDSNLCYAVEAVRGGSAAIDFNVRKSMNKIAGFINFYLGGTLDTRNRRMITPFKDIVGKKLS